VFVLIVFLLFAIDFSRLLETRFSVLFIEQKLLFLLLIVVLISTFFFNPQELLFYRNAVILCAYVLFITTFFFVFPRFLLENPPFFTRLIRAISIFGFLFSLFGFYLLYVNTELGRELRYQDSLVSIIPHPNNSSMILTTTIFPTLYYLYWKWGYLPFDKRFFYSFSLAVQVLGQLFTYTRAGMIGTAVGFLIFFILRHKSRFVFLFPLMVGFVLIFGIGFFTAKGVASFFGRFGLLIPAFQMITSSHGTMLWGYGFSSALTEYKKNLIAFDPSAFLIDDPHNSYVTLILMGGAVFSFFLLVLAAILLLKCLLKSVRSKGDERLFYIFLLSSLMAISTQGLFDAELVKVEFYTIQYLFICFGLLYRLVGQKEYNARLISEGSNLV